jgi:hypothetical protein
MIIGGPFVSKANAKPIQNIKTHHLFLKIITFRMENAHKVLKKSKVASVTDTFARAGTNIEVLKIKAE